MLAQKHVQTKIPTNTDTNKQINVLIGKHDAGVCGLSQKLSYYFADPFVWWLQLPRRVCGVVHIWVS